MTPRLAILLGGLIGASGVAAGAFGAHGLESVLSPRQLDSFEVAVRYQLLHALAIVLVAVLLELRPSRAAHVAAWLFLAGVALFSGGIYAWLFSGWKPLVHVVPVGGTAFIAGWLALALAGWRRPSPPA